jgi:hypothetical protein
MSKNEQIKIAIDVTVSLVSVKEKMEKLPIGSIDLSSWWALYEELQDFLNTKFSEE